MGVINILPRFIHELPGNEQDEFVYTSDAKYSLGTNIHRIVVQLVQQVSNTSSKRECLVYKQRVCKVFSNGIF